MSKMGDYNLQIEEQLADLGFATLEEAKQAGYGVELSRDNTVKLIKK